MNTKKYRKLDSKKVEMIYKRAASMDVVAIVALTLLDIQLVPALRTPQATRYKLFNRNLRKEKSKEIRKWCCEVVKTEAVIYEPGVGIKKGGIIIGDGKSMDRSIVAYAQTLPKDILAHFAKQAMV